MRLRLPACGGIAGAEERVRGAVQHHTALSMSEHCGSRHRGSECRGDGTNMLGKGRLRDVQQCGNILQSTAQGVTLYFMLLRKLCQFRDGANSPGIVNPQRKRTERLQNSIQSMPAWPCRRRLPGLHSEPGLGAAPKRATGSQLQRGSACSRAVDSSSCVPPLLRLGAPGFTRSVQPTDAPSRLSASGGCCGAASTDAPQPLHRS